MTKLWIWCFPQMLLGELVRIVTKARKVGDHYEFDIKSGSLSLGEYIFLCPAHWHDERVLQHERGHSRQSRLLGWLWLPLVGIPSLIWAGCFEEYRRKNGVDYYSFYTEKWADVLGGVKRG